ncbi:hypothetical protein [Pelomonas sp. BJYL3]|uniref:hypothetical protein n=1 Tax=Pelomonas sp. BJYL3 TaxID=2976697 RepID=UPI0022B49450|nr:hypothetical protein [Pelomonas sp. BJYL3]
MSGTGPWTAGRQRWARNLAFLSFSFANTACITVFPQHRFWGHPQEAMWTSAVLLGGALAALLGQAWATRRRGAALRPATTGAGWAAYAALLLVAGSKAVPSPLAYALLVWALSFSSGALMQRFDECSVQQAGPDGRVANDLSISLLRFLGMLLAPGAFSLMPPGSAAAQGLLLGMVALVALSGWRLLASAEAGAPGAAVSAPAVEAMPASASAALARSEWALWAAGVLVYANYCVLASAAPFLLRDLLAQPGAMARAWLLISAVYAAAMLSNALVQWRRWAPRLAWLPVAPVTLMLVGASLLMPAAASAGGLVLQLGASVALGAAFGLFMMGYRDHLTRQAVQLQRPALLARYNQLPRWATLLAFGVMAALSGLASLPGGAPRLAGSVAAYLLLSSLVVLGAMGAMRPMRVGTPGGKT